MLRWAGLFIIPTFAVVLAGCIGMPVAGPLTSEVVGNSDSAPVEYALVDVTPAVCDTLALTPPPSIRDVFGSASAPPVYAAHIGDTLSITVWEPGVSALFASTPSSSLVPAPRGTTLPPLMVEADGRITVPFAGRIVVVGKTPAEIQRLLAAGLAGKVADPQIVVTIVASQENAVTVGGEVAHGSRVPLGVSGLRVLDAVATAGGVRIPVNESVVRVTRHLRSANVTYSDLLLDQSKNIYLEPGDLVTVVRSPNTFTSFGAFGRAFQIAFEADSISLEEAIAKAGGLQDQRADPSGIFVFRFEPADLASAIAPGHGAGGGGTLVPVVYRVDLSAAGGYFLARRFRVHDKDIVYAANARMSEVQKFLNLLGSVLTPAATGASVSTGIR